MDSEIYDIFEEWCNEQGVKCEKNNKLFHIFDDTFVKPDFIIGGKVYIKFVNSVPKIFKYRETYKAFNNDHGPILVMPYGTVSDLCDSLTIKDIEKNFNLKIK